MEVIKTENLSKTFYTGFLRKKIPAVVDLNLTVQENEIFGFLGPNGAGKTTTIKLLMGLIYPTSGRAWVLGRDYKEVDIRKEIGFLPETPYFYEYLTGKEFLNFYGHLFKLTKVEREKRIEELLELVGLREAEDLQLRKYSKGMIQRLGIAQALINDPTLVIFDEPVSGLDPLGRKEIRDVLLRLKDEGKTVFFSTHIIPDVEMVCDRVGILNKGKMVAVGKIDELIGSGNKYTEITVTGLSKEALEELEKLGLETKQLGDKLLLTVEGDEKVNQVVELIKGKRGKLISLTPHKETLEELFIKEMGV
jgi:ABC-2 type transport system ATP-binding protein